MGCIGQGDERVAGTEANGALVQRFHHHRIDADGLGSQRHPLQGVEWKESKALTPHVLNAARLGEKTSEDLQRSPTVFILNRNLQTPSLSKGRGVSYFFP